MAELPTLDDWLALPEEQRCRLVDSWSAYTGQGEELLRKIVERFKSEYGHLRGLAVQGIGVYHCGYWVLGVAHPFVFDRRLLPQRYLGVGLRAAYSGPLPPEFRGENMWADENFERFVDRCAVEIRQKLGRPNMTREEMLQALHGRLWSPKPAGASQ